VIGLLAAVALGCDGGGEYGGQDSGDADTESEAEDADSDSDTESETGGGCSDADGPYTCPADSCSEYGNVLMDFIQGSEHYSDEDEACVCDMQTTPCQGDCIEQDGIAYCD
jgi:hypothetical protein